MILHIHSMLMHAGANQTLMQLQKIYWMPRGRQQVFSMVRTCRACARGTAQPYRQPTESNIPIFQLRMNEAPFMYIGLDTCGPFQVLKEQKYILIITCLVTRGVTFKVLDSLETHQIYAASRQIAARTNAPKFYLSNNAAQFLLIRDHILATNHEPVEWKFITDLGMEERTNA